MNGDEQTLSCGHRQSILAVHGAVFLFGLASLLGKTITDTGRRWRTYLGARDVTRLLLNRRIVCRMISHEGRRALLRPRTVAIGLVRRYTVE